MGWAQLTTHFGAGHLQMTFNAVVHVLSPGSGYIVLELLLDPLHLPYRSCMPRHALLKVESVPVLR